MTTELAMLHAEFNLFSQEDFTNRENIIKTLKKYPQNFEKLIGFYDNYSQFFRAERSQLPSKKCANNRDLPFIGDSAIEFQKVEFVFYFEGSKQDNKEQNNKKIGLTVLANLWLTENKELLNDFLEKEKWWKTKNYEYIKKTLNIEPEIIKHSYITDAVRFDDEKSNKALIEKEIMLLRPKLVICIGNAAKELVGMKYYEQDTKFHAIPFPSLRFKEKVAGKKHEFLKLNDILKRLQPLLSEGTTF